MSAKRKEDRFTEIRNAKASHQYIIHERYEAGIVLTGTEVKSIRMGKAQINEAFARVEKGEVILFHAHISEYAFGTWANHNPVRPRKLLLNKSEIRKIQGAVEAGGRTLVPTRMYLKHGLVKVEIGVCTGKKLHDKRETLKKRTEMREAEVAMRSRG
ncbi:MAG: SsrA-binding protein [Verrucomicrobia bacterium ADurb.Bin474]|nr:MAG: SsrA-binding protein [Verrucomicrobia bacterium ADurb.Bin474]